MSLRLLIVVVPLLVPDGTGAVLAAKRSPWPHTHERGDLGKTLPANASLAQVQHQIRSVNQVTSEHVGYAGTPSPVYQAFKRLKQLADKPMLRTLSRDRSPAMRVYAFLALADGQPDRVPFDVLLDHVEDIQTVGTMEGCLLGEAPVFDLMLRYVDGRLSLKQRTEVLERMLRLGRLTPGTEKALRSWRVEPRLSAAIRVRVIGGAWAALPALARFREAQDLPLIASGLVEAPFDGLAAVAEFPSPTFVPALRDMQSKLLDSRSFTLITTRDIASLRDQLPSQLVDDGHICGLYHAVFSYPHETAQPFLENALSRSPGSSADTRKAHALCIGAGLDPGNLGPFADVAFRIWEQEHQLSADLLRALWKNDQQRALRALAVSFEQVNEYSYYQLLPVLIQFVREHHPAPARVLNQAIPHAGSSHFKAVAKAVGELRDPGSLPLLFARIEGPGAGEWNPNIYMHAVDAILAYELDASQKRRLADWIVNRSPARRAQWRLDQAQLDRLEADLLAKARQHGLLSDR